mmetsp:Transcript_109686/g.163990  ORF Transcript_109686/g.163990 Transcript_109686/m.163990 type:complete len:219 (+) Transcript_109686:87-743(+)
MPHNDDDDDDDDGSVSSSSVTLVLPALGASVSWTVGADGRGVWKNILSLIVGPGVVGGPDVGPDEGVSVVPGDVESGEKEGLFEREGDFTLGDGDGTPLGIKEGVSEGRVDGIREGASEGMEDGRVESGTVVSFDSRFAVGWADGGALLLSEGISVPDSIGAKDGNVDNVWLSPTGKMVGAFDGCSRSGEEELLMKSISHSCILPNEPAASCVPSGEY